MSSENSDPIGPIDVLVVIKGLGLGGAERLLVDQVLVADGSCRYEVAHVRSDKNHFTPMLEEHGVGVHDLGAADGPWPLALRRLIAVRRPDVVHVHSPLPAAVVRLLVRFTGAGRRRGRMRTRIVYTEHNRWSAYRVPTRVVNAVTMPLDDAVLAVSDEARSSVRPRRLRERVETVHHGVDLAAIRSASEPEPTADPRRSADEVVLLHVANGRPEKAHEVLVAAFDRAAGERDDLVLWLVGQHLDRPWITEAVEGARHRDRIRVLGHRTDVPALIATADAVVLSSDHEGLPVVVMESLAIGRPILATAVGGIPEAIDDGVEGLLTPRRDVAALAGSFVRIASDPALRARLAAGAASAAGRFDGTRARTRQEAHYRRLTGGDALS